MKTKQKQMLLSLDPHDEEQSTFKFEVKTAEKLQEKGYLKVMGVDLCVLTKKGTKKIRSLLGKYEYCLINKKGTRYHPLTKKG